MTLPPSMLDGQGQIIPGYGNSPQYNWSFTSAVGGHMFSTRPDLPNGVSQNRFDQDRAFAASTYLNHLAVGAPALAAGTYFMAKAFNNPVLNAAGRGMGTIAGGGLGATVGAVGSLGGGLAGSAVTGLWNSTVGTVFGANATMVSPTSAVATLFEGIAARTVGAAPGGWAATLGGYAKSAELALRAGVPWASMGASAGAGLGAFVGGALLPAYVAGKVADVGFSAYERTKTFSDFEKELRDKSERILYGQASSFESGRGGFSSAQNARFLNHMSAIAERTSAGSGMFGGKYNILGGANVYNNKMSELKNLFSVGADLGMFEGANGYEDIERKMDALVRQTTRLVKVLAKSKAEIAVELAKIQQSGATNDIDEAGAILRNRKSVATMSGLSENDVANDSNDWSRRAAARGMSGASAINMYNQNLIWASLAESSGAANSREMYLMGGRRGLANKLTQSMDIFSQTDAMARYALFFSGPNGEVDMDRVRAAGRGKMAVDQRVTDLGQWKYTSSDRESTLNRNQARAKFLANASSDDVLDMMNLIINDSADAYGGPRERGIQRAIVDNLGLNENEASVMAKVWGNQGEMRRLERDLRDKSRIKSVRDAVANRRPTLWDRAMTFGGNEFLSNYNPLYTWTLSDDPAEREQQRRGLREHGTISGNAAAAMATRQQIREALSRDDYRSSAAGVGHFAEGVNKAVNMSAQKRQEIQERVAVVSQRDANATDYFDVDVFGLKSESDKTKYRNVNEMMRAAIGRERGMFSAEYGLMKYKGPISFSAEDMVIVGHQLRAAEQAGAKSGDLHEMKMLVRKYTAASDLGSWDENDVGYDAGKAAEFAETFSDAIGNTSPIGGLTGSTAAFTRDMVADAASMTASERAAFKAWHKSGKGNLAFTLGESEEQVAARKELLKFGKYGNRLLGLINSKGWLNSLGRRISGGKIGDYAMGVVDNTAPDDVIAREMLVAMKELNLVQGPDLEINTAGDLLKTDNMTKLAEGMTPEALANRGLKDSSALLKRYKDAISGTSPEAEKYYRDNTTLGLSKDALSSPENRRKLLVDLFASIKAEHGLSKEGADGQAAQLIGANAEKLGTTLEGITAGIKGNSENIHRTAGLLEEMQKRQLSSSNNSWL